MTLLYRISVCVAFLFAIGLRIYMPDTHRSIIPGDETTYHFSAGDLLRYHTLTREVDGDMYHGKIPAVATSALSPGYPLYIAMVYLLTDNSTHAVLQSQVVMSIGIFALIFVIMTELSVARWAIVLTLLAAAIYPGFLYNIDRLLTEQLFLLLFVGFSYAFVRGLGRENWRWMGIAGVILGLAVHVRAEAIPFALMAAVFIAVYGRAYSGFIRQSMVAFLVCFIVVMLPWWIRNYLDFGHFILVTNAAEGPRIWGAVPYFIDMPSAQGSAAQVASSNIAAQPWIYYQWRSFGFLANMFYDVWDEHQVHPSMLLRWPLLLQPFVIVPSLACIPLLLRSARPTAMFILLIPIAIVVTAMPFHGLPRYAFPSIPFIFIATSLLLTRLDRRHAHAGFATNVDGLLSAWRRVTDRLMRWGGVAIGAALGLALLYSVYIFSYRENDQMSSYRLAKYMDIDLDAQKHMPVISTMKVDSNDLIIDNTRTNSPHNFVNLGTGPSIAKIKVPRTQADGKIVSRITLKMRGGFPFDYTTIYWTTPGMKDFDESHVFTLPVNRWKRRQQIYVDGDVTNILLVPYRFQFSRFKLDSVRIDKLRAAQPRAKQETEL